MYFLSFFLKLKPFFKRNFIAARYSNHFVALSHFGVSTSPPHSSRHAPGIYQCLRYIIKNEGARGLFKGLGPNLIGVAPSRAIYFCAYSKSKVAFNAILPPDTPIVHVFAASCAGECNYVFYYYYATFYQSRYINDVLAWNLHIYIHRRLFIVFLKRSGT